MKFGTTIMGVGFRDYPEVARAPRGAGRLSAGDAIDWAKRFADDVIGRL